MKYIPDKQTSYDAIKGRVNRNHGNGKLFFSSFLAPIREYLEDDEVSEILINGPGKVYIEKHGKLQKTAAQFTSEQALRAAASNIAKSVGQEIVIHI